MRKFLSFLTFALLVVLMLIQPAAISAETGGSLGMSSGWEPPTCQLTLDKDNVSIGEQIAVSWIISGGENPPYTYDQWNSGWIVFEGDQTQHQFVYGTVNGNSNTWTPAFGTRAYFMLSLLDANGDMLIEPIANSVILFESKEFIILSDEAVAPLQISVSLDKGTVNVGGEITATVHASGGEPPYSFEYSWFVYDQVPGWNEIVKKEETTNASSTVRPQFSLLGRLTVTANDSAGRSMYDSSSFTISGGQTLDQKVSQIAGECHANASGSYARAKWLHDYLIKNAEYDYTYTHYSPYGVLMLGTGICQSYATAYQLLLNKAGISNKYISAEANNGSGWDGHAWNLVNIGGNWYHVDVTWDDGSASTRYFLKSDKSMSADHRWDASKYPACPYDWGKAPEAKMMPGDATNDGTIDILDLVTIIDYIVSNTSPASQVNADANGDGAVDILDLVWIIDSIVSG